MLLWADSMNTAGKSMGCSLWGWKNSATRSTIIPRGSATAPMRVVIAVSPPTCLPLASRASIASSFQRGPDPKPRVWPTLMKQAHYTPLVPNTTLNALEFGTFLANFGEHPFQAVSTLENGCGRHLGPV